MDQSLFGSDLWKPALDKYAEATGLSVELFGVDGRVVLNSMHATPLAQLFREYGYEPGLFAECARRCLRQTYSRPAVVVDESHGLTVVGTSLVLESAIVGAAVAGYGLAHFSQVPAVQRLAKSARVPFGRLWDIARRLPPVPERRLLLHGELLQILGDALLRENYRTRQYEETTAKLKAASAAKDEFLAVLSHELRTPLAAAAAKAEHSASALAGLSVLVVGDVEDARDTLRVLLQHLGAQVSVACGAREGLDMIQDADPDLVLCDLRMPRMDGFEFIRHLHREASSAHLPVIAVTALASDADRERTREAGFAAHVKKPFDVAAIVAAVQAASRPDQAERGG